MIVGDGKFKYQLAENWEQLPKGWYRGDVAGVATDSRDNVYVFNRSEHPVIVYDREGKFLGSWGEGIYTRPHGITIVNDIAYLADDTDHTVRKCTLDGKILMTLGTVDQPSDTGYDASAQFNLSTIKRGAAPFNRPTKLSIGPNGDLYVSDGYGNARVHRFTADGKLVTSWGEPGEGPGQFNLPHSVLAHSDGRIWVCDRENDRIQFFGPNGEYQSMWENVVHRPMDLYIDRNDVLYVLEGSHAAGGHSMHGKPLHQTLNPELSVRDTSGSLLTKWGGAEPTAPGQFAAPHGIWVDGRGDIYVAEVTHTALTRTNQWFPGAHALQKFVRI
ncbi:MAG: peptidyl-alpha-hydroxyglycine alpha-amidating lyase family protein [Chloroflexota bacterium]